MCMNCGCGMVEDRHGSKANITADDLRQAAQASGVDLSTTLANMRESLGKLETTGAGAMSGSASGHAGGYGSSSGATGQAERGQAD